VSTSQLPACRWRAGTLPGGRHRCASPKVITGPAGVSDATCARCFCPDHAPVGPAVPPPPCVHLGAATGDLAECESCKHTGRRLRLKVFACAPHGTCTPETAAPGLACCASCPDRTVSPPDGPVTRDSTPAAFRRILESPPDPSLPADWPRWPGARAAFLAAFEDAAAHIPPPPEFADGVGVVIAAGGWRFFPGLYVTVRMLRHVGCRWPVQCWYLGDRGEFDPRMELALRPYGVGWVDADEFVRKHPGVCARVLNGWELKALAACHCPWREVLSLDADCYPVRDPEVLRSHPRHRAAGATFYRDIGRLSPDQWAAFGLPWRDEHAFESGQFLADRSRHWPALWLAVWLNSHSDYTYNHVYGDKDLFNVAWRRLGHAFDSPTPDAPWDRVAFLHQGYDGRTLFVHRCRDKMRWSGEHDGSPVDQRYMTHQGRRETQFIPHFPLEAEAHRFLGESREAVQSAALLRHRWVMDAPYEPWLHAYVRPGGDVFVDVGANEGLWTRALAPAYRLVHAVEPNPDALPRLGAGLPANVTVHPWAAWGGEGTLSFVRREQSTHAAAEALPQNPGGGRVLGVAGVPCRPLDALDPGGHLDFLKVDVEGAEAEVLRGSARLLREYRPWLLVEVHSVPLLHEVQALLATHGYVQTVIRHPHYEPFSLPWQKHCWITAQPALE
jgi:FkbM family methyltransferase